MYSDSLTYEKAVTDFGPDDEIVSLGGNYLGPLTVLRLFDSNRIAIHFFNLGIVLVSVMAALRYLEVRRDLLLAGILSSPLLFFSTFGVNKEVFLLPFSIVLLIYMQRRSLIWLLYAVILALFVRWQIVLFVFLLVGLNSRLNLLRRRRWLMLLLLAGAISVIYPVLLSQGLDAIEQISIEGTEAENESGASGTYGMMQSIQREGGYLLVVIPKTLQLLVGLLLRFDPAAIADDFWNNFVIMSQSFHNLVLVSMALLQRRLRIAEDQFYLMCCFAVMFALTPVFAPRYFYPLAIWLALLLASKRPLALDIAPGEIKKNP